MDVRAMADTLAHSSMCYLMATWIYQEMYKFSSEVNRMACVWTHLIEKGINYYILTL